MWLYDAKTNVLKQMKGYEIAQIAGIEQSSVTRAMQRQSRLATIGCYVFKERPPLKVRKELYAKETFEAEVWRKIPDSAYEVSVYGRVRTKYKGNYVFVMPRFGNRFSREYLVVKIDINGIKKDRKVRDIVASVFLKKPKYNDQYCVVHKNGDFTDCCALNLKYEKMSIMFRENAKKSTSKPVVQVDEKTLEIINEWNSAAEACAANFMSRQAMQDRCNGSVKTRKDGWFMWEVDYEQQFGQLFDIAE